MPQSDVSLALFVQHMPAAAALLDRSLVYVMTSTRWCEDFGLPSDSIHGTSHFASFSESEAAWRGRFDRALAGEVLKGTDSPITRVTGQTFWVDWELRPWYRESEVAGVMLFAQDQSQRKLAQDAQRRLEANLNVVLDSSTQAFILIDNDYRIVVTNRLARRYAKQIAGEVAQEGRSLLEYVPPALRARFKSRMDTAMLEQRRLTISWQDAAGSWFEIECTPVQGEIGAARGLCISLDDVTVRRRAAYAQQQYSELLEDRNRDLQEFAYVASHDLQEPLRKVRAFSSLLAEEYQDRLDGTGTLYLDRITGAAGRMSMLINALLSYARVSTRVRAFVDVDLGEVVADVLSDLEIKIAEKAARIEVGLLPTVTADETQMRQLFQNLIGNALKFHPPDETPHVRIVQREASGRLPGTAEVIEMIVQDHGIGFERDEAEQIFDPFQRLHGRAEYEGTGMGLAICRRIAERHGGTLRAAAEPGSGATFVLRLPAHSGADVGENVAPEPHAHPATT